MTVIRWIATLCWCLVLGRTGWAAPPLVLATGGEARLPIVMAATADAELESTATDLARILTKISGAEFKIQKHPGTNLPASGIILGTLQQFPVSALKTSLAMKGAYDGKEAYAIRTETDRLLLIGNTSLGASHAAYRFLETLGVRRFFPAPEWEVVPDKRELRISNLQETSRPAFLFRRIWSALGHYVINGAELDKTDFAAWRRHNRMGHSLQTYTGHAWPSVMLTYPEEMKAHPEYLALRDGKRQTLDTGDRQFCVAQAGARQLVVNYALKYFKDYPAADMIAIGPNDGSADCECAGCAKIGTISDRVFTVANEAARAVAAQYPGKMVGVLAYSDYSEPPSFALEPNVYVQLTAGYNYGRYSFDELLQLWSRKAKNFGLYEYYSIWVADYDRPPGRGGAAVTTLQKNIQQYHKLGLSSLDAEASNNWGLFGRGAYVANRLMWNPQTDVTALLNDFYQKAFGPGAAAMKRYYERLDPGPPPYGTASLVSEHMLALAFRDLEEAARLTREDTAVQARINQLKQYMHYVRLRWEYDKAEDTATKKALVVDILRHLYRTQRSYMVYTKAYLTGWTTNLAIEYKEPTWNAYTDNTPKPWEEIKAPYSVEETERLFQEALKRFQPVEVVAEKSWPVNDMVAVDFGTPSQTKAPTTGLYFFGEKFGVWMQANQPVKLDVTTGTVYSGAMKPPFRYTLTTPEGRVLNTGKLPLDKKVHPLEFKVARTGYYLLELQPNSSGYYMTAAPDARLTLLGVREGNSHCGAMPPQYFYVPRGTRRLQYYTTMGYHEIVDPTGKIAHTEKVYGGRYVTVEVPEGMDGQPWGLRHACIGQMHFLNVPNLFAASPYALLLPRTLVVQDGLKTAQ